MGEVHLDGTHTTLMVEKSGDFLLGNARRQSPPTITAVGGGAIFVCQFAMFDSNLMHM